MGNPGKPNTCKGFKAVHSLGHTKAQIQFPSLPVSHPGRFVFSAWVKPMTHARYTITNRHLKIFSGLYCSETLALITVVRYRQLCMNYCNPCQRRL